MKPETVGKEQKNASVCVKEDGAAVKRLEDMSLAELWELFPIVLAEPDPIKWREDYMAEEKTLGRILGSEAVCISHVGSTAVGTIKSKPVVDMIAETDDVAECSRILADAGYIKMRGDENSASFNKGYTTAGYADRVYHIHVRKRGDADEKYFCAYLKENPDVAKQYEALKIRLLAEYGKDRDGYTEAKTAFVKRITELAKRKARE